VTESPGFVAVERQSVVSLAIEQIRRMIASGALVSGQQLPSERALADLFGVSRPTVREAIRALVFSGILEARHGSGTYVASSDAHSLAKMLVPSLSVSAEALDDLMEVRMWLDVGAAGRSAENASPAQVRELYAIVDQMRSLVADVKGFVDADIRFHRVLHETSGNAVYSSLTQTMNRLIEESLLVTAQTLGVRDQTIGEHEAIARAIESADPVAARQAMQDHLTNARRDLFS
jgi:GntR family transcriptional regulator, transcriptional repressor for pyruvate dehydrogenase complex